MMDPFSLMVFSIIVSGVIVHSAWDAGVDQAKAEARLAAETIRKDLLRRRKAWAKQLNDRLDEGRKAGPATAMWWGWAALRTAKAIRRGLKRDPRAAEKAIGGPTGPFRRIFGAARRGAQYARDEARRQREAHDKTTREPVGVCGRCGAVVAKKALVWALTRFDRQEQMCASCRATVEAEREADEKRARTEERTKTGPAAEDADVVTDSPRQISQPASADAPPAASRPDGSPSTANTPSTTAATTPIVTVERADHKPAPQPATVAADDRPALNPAPGGDPMARSLVPARGGAVATRNTAVMRRGGGDSYTHGQWNRATADIRRRLEMLPALLEQVLHSLNAADAGRAQVNGVMAFHQDALNLISEVTTMLIDVNRRGVPVVEAVTAAGGPSEIPTINYFREI